MPNNPNNLPYSGDNNPFGAIGTNSPWSNFENGWFYHQNDMVDRTSVYGALYPYEAQYSEWSQQMVATMYQNWYNSAPEQMQRAMAAGINPFVAASGIAGSGSSGVASAPPTVQNKAPEMLSAAGSALASAFGGNFNSFAQGYATLSKLRHEIGKIDAETSNLFETLGFTNLQSRAMSIQLKYMDSKEQIGVWQALASFEKTSQEFSNLVAQHENILAQYDEIIANRDLLVAEKGEVEARKILDDAMARKENAIASWQETENKFFAAHGYKLGSPIYEGLRDMMVSNGTFDMNSFGDVVSSYEGKVTSAVEGAKASASWDYRPSNAAEAAAYIGTHLGESLRNIILGSQDVSSWSELKLKIDSSKAAKDEFTNAYKDAKEDLYENYLSKKRYYRNIKRGGNTAEVARALNAMNDAKEEYDKFTEEVFGMRLLSQTFQNETSSAQ